MFMWLINAQWSYICDLPRKDNILLCTPYALSNDTYILFIQVVIADESHFLKNAQAKRTTAALPVIKVFLS
jgi:uncharacterized protein YdeI (YjbR/CyaY-like superfamily)